MPGPPAAVWVLRGDTDFFVECWITESAESLWNVIVTHGGDPVLHECYPDVPSALRQAAAVRDGLLARGWRADAPQADDAPDASGGPAAGSRLD